MPHDHKGVVLSDLGLLIFGGVDMGSLTRSGGLTAQMMMPDTRDVAGKWLKDKGDVTVGLASDPWFWSPSVHPESGITRMVGQKALLEMWAGWTNPKIALYIPPNPADRFQWDARLVTELKPEYIAASSFEYVPFKRLSEQSGGGDFEKLFGERYREFKTAIEKDYDVVFITNVNHHEMVEDMEYVRPNVLIWQRKKTSANP